MQSTEQKIERAALAGLAAASMDERERSTDISLAELAALVETAGGQPVVTLLQNKPTPDPRTFLGEGKVAELKELILANDCDLAVFDNELSPSQMRVLEEELGVRVLDRSGLILDIFAQRAQTPAAAPDRYVDAPCAPDGLRRLVADRHARPGRNAARDRPPPHSPQDPEAAGRA